ncbi:MAG: DUF262 domain-containing protein [Bdellovibrionaceae bacterium]|nr:DUF262 domain-containing protein [Pseudobdellovibrionaceae bacterium]
MAKRSKILDEIEEETFVADDSDEVPPTDIIAFNELRSCADLHRLHTEGVLEIQPSFQREVVWPETAQTRFIDSLIKRLPIPSMCFSFDYKSEKWQVIDGLQRMSSIVRFLSGDSEWRLANVDDITPDLRGKFASDFVEKGSSLSKYYQRVKDISIPITVLRCDLSKEAHSEYLFTIFHRLNSGGMKLNSQEIRNCIFSGAFNDLLHDLNETSSWKKLNKMKHTKGYRFRKEELILRFFAFHERSSSYNGRLSKFLNDYMRTHRNLSNKDAESKSELFTDTVDFVWKDLLKGTFPPRLSVTTLEGLLIGVAANLKSLQKGSPSKLQTKLQKFYDLDEFSEASLVEGLSKKQKVLDRLNAAKDAFR